MLHRIQKARGVRMIDFQKPQTWIVAWCEYHTPNHDNMNNGFSVLANYQAAWSKYNKLLQKDNLHSASLAVIVESTDY